MGYPRPLAGRLLRRQGPALNFTAGLATPATSLLLARPVNLPVNRLAAWPAIWSGRVNPGGSFRRDRIVAGFDVGFARGFLASPPAASCRCGAGFIAGGYAGGISLRWNAIGSGA